MADQSNVYHGCDAACHRECVRRLAVLTRQQGKVDQTLASLFLALILSAGTALGKEQENSLASDAAVKKAIIADSLSRYPGPCPCPYNVARNGSRCGKRSAYSRP